MAAKESKPDIKKLKIKLFSDGANLEEMKEMYQRGLVKGFTTNPTLMRKAGVSDYEAFAKKVLAAIPDLPISFEVFSDEFDAMEREVRKIAGWGKNIHVKIPITNTRQETSIPLIRKLGGEGFSLNITAVFTLDQVRQTAEALGKKSNSIISIFAGRIADSGRDPMPIMEEAHNIMKPYPKQELLWASSREILNIFQAEACGCHIITVTADLLKKLAAVGRELNDFSLDTVKMFYQDAKAAGYKI